ncbi:LysR substrate-binding domain-containing protein [Pseudomonas aeruginosa]
MRFQLYSLSSEQVLEGLARNQFDLGVSYLDRLDRSHFEGIELAETRMGLLHHPSHFPLDAALLNWEALAGLPLGLLSAGMHFRQSIDHNRSRGLSPIARLETDSGTATAAGGAARLVLRDHAAGQRSRRRVAPDPHRGRPYLAALGLIIRSGASRARRWPKPVSRKPGTGWRRSLDRSRRSAHRHNRLDAAPRQA